MTFCDIFCSTSTSLVRGGSRETLENSTDNQGALVRMRKALFFFKGLREQRKN